MNQPSADEAHGARHRLPSFSERVDYCLKYNTEPAERLLAEMADALDEAERRHEDALGLLQAENDRLRDELWQVSQRHGEDYGHD